MLLRHAKTIVLLLIPTFVLSSFRPIYHLETQRGQCKLSRCQSQPYCISRGSFCVPRSRLPLLCDEWRIEDAPFSTNAKTFFWRFISTRLVEHIGVRECNAEGQILFFFRSGVMEIASPKKEATFDLVDQRPA